MLRSAPEKLLPHSGLKDLFAQPNRLWCDLDELVFADVLEGVLSSRVSLRMGVRLRASALTFFMLDLGGL
jgi:hypothetical protein